MRKKLNNLPETSSDETSDEKSHKTSDETSDDNDDNNDDEDLLEAEELNRRFKNLISKKRTESLEE